jgi:hypothetical protein
MLELGHRIQITMFLEHPPILLDRGHHGVLLCVFGGDFRTEAKYFEINLRLRFTPFGHRFQSFMTVFLK